MEKKGTERRGEVYAGRRDPAGYIYRFEYEYQLFGALNQNIAPKALRKGSTNLRKYGIIEIRLATNAAHINHNAIPNETCIPSGTEYT